MTYVLFVHKRILLTNRHCCSYWSFSVSNETGRLSERKGNELTSNRHHNEEGEPLQAVVWCWASSFSCPWPMAWVKRSRKTVLLGVNSSREYFIYFSSIMRTCNVFVGSLSHYINILDLSWCISKRGLFSQHSYCISKVSFRIDRVYWRDKWGLRGSGMRVAKLAHRSTAFHK